ncbi:transposase [Xanthomonas oryzae pv. oryzae]|nr:transposase [Xanthomonas oryzae pv. oryzae]
MQGLTCGFGVLELPVFITLRTGFWQFSGSVKPTV